LREAGHDVVAVSGASPAAKHLLPGVAHLQPDEVAARATDLLIVAVPDDALSGVISGLARMGVLQPNQIVAHTSGAHGLDVLAPAIAAGAQPLALHPAMTFAGTAGDLERLRGVSFGVTAPPSLVGAAAALVEALGGKPEWIANEKRSLYHAALAHGANHLVTLINEAADRLRDAGVLQPEKVLGPLVHAALENALSMGDNALTGPVSRGDAGTIARHIAVIGETAPDSLPVYRALARRTADRAISTDRLRSLDAEALLDVLADPAKVEAAS
jgi:predicted short-subunit dehydrogenase-like oxidoreductase (DUF2520 family)